MVQCSPIFLPTSFWTILIKDVMPHYFLIISPLDNIWNPVHSKGNSREMIMNILWPAAQSLMFHFPKNSPVQLKLCCRRQWNLLEPSLIAFPAFLLCDCRFGAFSVSACLFNFFFHSSSLLSCPRGASPSSCDITSVVETYVGDIFQSQLFLHHAHRGNLGGFLGT